MPSPPPLRLLHCITGLNPGGAETVCVTLCRRLAALPGRSMEQHVVSLLPEGALAAPLREAGIPVTSWGLTKGVGSLAGMARLLRTVRTFRPHVIQGWMYHGDAAASLAKYCAPSRPALAWGIHNYKLSPDVLPLPTRLLLRLLAISSRWAPDVVVSCAESAKASHMNAGYAPRRWEVIPNGVDVARFRPDAALRTMARTAWGIPETTPVVGMATRDHPVKDLPTFAAAVAAAMRDVPDLHVVLCGQGMVPENAALLDMLTRAGIAERCLLLGMVQNMPTFWNGVDVAVSSSVGEALSMSLAEAMACGVPVAATEVGDTATLVGDGGLLVPVGEAASLAEAIVRCLGHRGDLGATARRRIEAAYSLDACAYRYATLYAALVSARME